MISRVDSRERGHFAVTLRAAIPDLADLSFESRSLRHLPVLREAIDRLGIRDVVQELLPMDPRSAVSDADCVTVMIANILGGRVALYGMGEWLRGADTDVLLWEGCPGDAFEDDRLGKALDHLFDAGTDNVLSAVASRYLLSDDAPREYAVHGDTTSISFEGAYDVEDRKPGSPRPTYGHSKDLRPDLKQLVYGLSLHGAVGIPLCASMLDGNTSDHRANRLRIDKLAALLPPEDEVTLVADCKLVDEETLGRARRVGFHYVSLMPRSFAVVAEVVEAVRTGAAAMVEVGRYPGRTKADPERVYRAVSFERAVRLEDPVDGEVEPIPHRLLVVESSQLATHFEAALPGKLEREKKQLEARFRRLVQETHACADDAQKAVSAAAGVAELHHVRARVFAAEETLPRPRRGRPAAGEEAPTRTVWRIVLDGFDVDEAVVETERFHARHFVLITDHLDATTWPDPRIFETYRAQHVVEGHTGFRWLKGPAMIAPVFLKLPHRIAALGLVFLLALMVRNWLEARIRAALAARQEKLPDMNDRPTARPTMEATMRLFQFLTVLRVHQGDTLLQRQLHNLDDIAGKALDLLGFDVAVLTRPRRKWALAPPGSSK